MAQIFNSDTTYGAVSKLFHWVIFTFVFIMLSCSYFMDDISNKMLRGVVINAHKLLGLTILALMVLRLCWTLMNRKPKLFFTHLWERWAERSVHYLLYFTLIAMPISGWVMAVAAGHPPRWGNLVLTLPIEKNEWLSGTGFSVHYWLAIVIIALVSMHALAALFHHFFKKDNVLQRMLP